METTEVAVRDDRWQQAALHCNSSIDRSYRNKITRVEPEKIFGGGLWVRTPPPPEEQNALCSLLATLCSLLQY